MTDDIERPVRHVTDDIEGGGGRPVVVGLSVGPALVSQPAEREGPAASSVLRAARTVSDGAASYRCCPVRSHRTGTDHSWNVSILRVST